MVIFSGRVRLWSASEHNYLNPSECLQIPNIDNEQKFHNLMVNDRSWNTHLFFSYSLISQPTNHFCVLGLNL